MRIGLFQGVVEHSKNVADQVQAMIDAEKLGFDSVWITETTRSEALTTIALAGQRTDRIELGSAVIPMHPWLHRHPLSFSQHALTVQAAVGGRLLLGLGATRTPTGSGYNMDLYRKPVTHMREFIKVLRCLVYEKRVDIRGEIFRVRATLDIPDADPFPIILAALGPRMLQVAGELADGTITWMVGTKAMESHIVPRLTYAADKAKRTISRVVFGVPLAVSDDSMIAREAASSYFGHYARLPSYQRMLEIEGVKGPENLAIVGKESEVEDKVLKLAELGVTDFIASIFPVGNDKEDSLHRTRELLKSLVGKI